MRDKEGCSILTKVSIQQEDKTVINIHVPNERSSKCMKQKLTDLKGEIDSSIIIAGDFNTMLKIMDRTIRQKISKEIRLNTVNQLDLKYIHRTLFNNSRIHIFLKCT